MNSMTNYINITCPPLPYFILSGKSIYRPGDCHEKRTLHNCFDFIYVNSGRLHIQQDDWDLFLEEGDFFIIVPEALHQSNKVCTEKTVISWVHFYTDGDYTLSGIFHPENKIRRAAPKFFYSAQTFILSLPRYGTIPELDRTELHKCLNYLSQISFSRYTKEKSFPKVSLTPFEVQLHFIELLKILYMPLCQRYDKKNIAQLVHEYFDIHYMENITLKQLEQKYSYSPSHLIRCFKQTYQYSPMQYLKKLRIENAARLLTSSDLSIQTIGEKVGFSTTSYFIREFKKELGMTPAQYRAQNIMKK